MDRQLAQKLLKVVNNKEIHDILIEYTEYRIDEIKDRLVFCNPDELRGLQNSVAELRRFKTLRDEVLKAGEK
jgi:hypothetical protein